MRTNADALRSLKRYAALMLGDDWEVRLPGEEGTFERPFARVVVADAAQYRAATKYLTEAFAPFAVYTYPAKGATADEALMGALGVEEMLFQGFHVGVPDEGSPMRVPLYDYDGVPLSEPSLARFEHDYLRVSDLSTRHFADPDDRTLWSVVTDVRLSWRRTVLPVATGLPVTAVTIAPA